MTGKSWVSGMTYKYFVHAGLFDVKDTVKYIHICNIER